VVWRVRCRLVVAAADRRCARRAPAASMVVVDAARRAADDRSANAERGANRQVGRGRPPQ